MLDVGIVGMICGMRRVNFFVALRRERFRNFNFLATASCLKHTGTLVHVWVTGSRGERDKTEQRRDTLKG